MASKKRKLEPDEDASLSIARIEGAKKTKLDASGETYAETPERILCWDCLELDNRIYDFILLDVRNRTVYDKLTVAERTAYPRMIHDVMSSSVPVRSKHIAVSHVCRMLRNEFRPLLLARRHVVIPLHSLDEYLAVFGQDGVGDIAVLYKPLLTRDGGVNILPPFDSGSSSLSMELEPRPRGLLPCEERNSVWRFIWATEDYVHHLMSLGYLEQIRLHATSTPNGPILIDYYLNEAQCADWDLVNDHSTINSFLCCCDILKGFPNHKVEIRIRCAAWGDHCEVPKSRDYGKGETSKVLKLDVE